MGCKCNSGAGGGGYELPRIGGADAPPDQPAMPCVDQLAGKRAAAERRRHLWELALVVVVVALVVGR